jgi:3-hydroxypropanoate dehydrogenase
MADALNSDSLGQLFTEAHTHNAWHDKQVPDDTLRRLVDILKMGPTSANCSPARFRFIKSAGAKERLLKHMSEGNQEKTRTAPVTAIVAYDLEFYENLPKLFPHTDAKSWFVGSETAIYETAYRNSSLQGAYMIIAARALGLDAGPMSGFDREGVDKEFFSGTPLRSNFVCNLGYGDPAGVRDRGPRLSFDEMAAIL